MLWTNKLWTPKDCPIWPMHRYMTRLQCVLITLFWYRVSICFYLQGLCMITHSGHSHSQKAFIMLFCVNNNQNVHVDWGEWFLGMISSCIVASLLPQNIHSISWHYDSYVIYIWWVGGIGITKFFGIYFPRALHQFRASIELPQIQQIVPQSLPFESNRDCNSRLSMSLLVRVNPIFGCSLLSHPSINYCHLTAWNKSLINRAIYFEHISV